MINRQKKKQRHRKIPIRHEFKLQLFLSSNVQKYNYYIAFQAQNSFHTSKKNESVTLFLFIFKCFLNIFALFRRIP